MCHPPPILSVLEWRHGGHGGQAQVLVTLLQQKILVFHHLQCHHQVLFLLLHLGHHGSHLHQPLLLLQYLRPRNLDVLTLEGLLLLNPSLQEPGRVLPELDRGKLGWSHVVECVDEYRRKISWISLQSSQ